MTNYCLLNSNPLTSLGGLKFEDTNARKGLLFTTLVQRTGDTSSSNSSWFLRDNHKTDF